MATETDPDPRSLRGLRSGVGASDDAELGRRLVENLVETQLDLLTWPHIVVCTEGSAGVTSYTGPYPDAIAAVEAAAELEDGADEPRLRCVVAPLFPG